MKPLNFSKTFEKFSVGGEVRTGSRSSANRVVPYLGELELVCDDLTTTCIARRSQPRIEKSFQLTDNIKSVQLDDAKLSLYVLLKDGQYFRVASNHMGDQRYKFNRDVKRFSKAMIAIMENDLDAFIDVTGFRAGLSLSKLKKPDLSSRDDDTSKQRKRVHQDKSESALSKRPSPPRKEKENETNSLPDDPLTSHEPTTPENVKKASPLSFYKADRERYASPFDKSLTLDMMTSPPRRHILQQPSTPKRKPHFSARAATLVSKATEPKLRHPPRSLMDGLTKADGGQLKPGFRPLDDASNRALALSQKTNTAMTSLGLHRRDDDDDENKGFTNLGNTCYMNAILQALLSLKAFTMDLANDALLRAVNRKSFYGCMYRLMRDVETGAIKTVQNIHLAEFKKCLEMGSSKFSGYSQHDAHEFLAECLSRLEEDVKGVNGRSVTEGEQRSPISLNFESCVESKTTCKECKYETELEESYHSFSLDIPQPDVLPKPSLQLMLERYFQDEVVERTCPQCSCKRSIRSQSFRRLPRILILLVKRYEVTVADDGVELKKRSDSVTIPCRIGVDSICQPSVEKPPQMKSKRYTRTSRSWKHAKYFRRTNEKLESKSVTEMTEDEQIELALKQSLLESTPKDDEGAKKQNDNGGGATPESDETENDPVPRGSADLTYDLVSVVSHLGEASSAGHYVADIYDVAKDAWKSCNDSIVSKTSESRVRKERGSCGYIFFFAQRQTLSSLKSS
ncbi:ubiquitin carboxyl-terminal hydrolase 37-like isoform X2 [Oscarella lobularis]|uniref:ubiquitin carboxyl-terminal hydrolase 37-like isoform X2 n=1 Tax=Oscarella lobularis TaxID=121494 RepID=UPI0033134108